MKKTSVERIMDISEKLRLFVEQLIVDEGATLLEIEQALEGAKVTIAQERTRTKKKKDPGK